MIGNVTNNITILKNHIFDLRLLPTFTNFIGGSKGGARDAQPPRGPNSFIFMQFLAKIINKHTHFGSWRPPPGKILDPPLNLVCFMQKFSGSIFSMSIISVSCFPLFGQILQFKVLKCRIIRKVGNRLFPIFDYKSV